MRGARAKSLRKYMANTMPMLPEEPRYKRLPSGTIVLDDMCLRKQQKNLKNNYKRKQRGMELK